MRTGGLQTSQRAFSSSSAPLTGPWRTRLLPASAAAMGRRRCCQTVLLELEDCHHLRSDTHLNTDLNTPKHTHENNLTHLNTHLSSPEHTLEHDLQQQFDSINFKIYLYLSLLICWTKVVFMMKSFSCCCLCCCSDEAERHRHSAEPDRKKYLRLSGENLR